MPGRGGEFRSGLDNAHPKMIHRLKPLLGRHPVNLFQYCWHGLVPYAPIIPKLPDDQHRARLLRTLAAEEADAVKEEVMRQLRVRQRSVVDADRMDVALV